MWGLLAALALVALNAFFVGAEFAMVRVQPQRLERLAKKGGRRAKVAYSIATDLERYLPVSQIGITLASLGLGWIGEPAIAAQVNRLAEVSVGHPLGYTAHGIATGLAFAFITYLHVLLGEQMPKMIALHRAEAMAIQVALPMRAFYYALFPALFLLSGATSVLLRAFGLRGEVDGDKTLSEEDLLGVIAATLARGTRAADKRQLLERVVRFGSRQARHAMVPRVDVAYLPIRSRGSFAIAYLRAEAYSRVVLCEKDDLDHVVGYLYAKDLLLDPNAEKLPNLRSVRRDVLFVPEPQSLIDVLRAMQRAHTLFAIVVDEYGGTSGLITMEDILEEIVGEIRDEADDEEVPNLREVANVPGVWDVLPRTPVDELRPLGIDIAENEPELAGETVGGYVVNKLGRPPRRGDRVRMGAFDAEVRVIRRRRLERLRLYPHTPTVVISTAPPSSASMPDGDGGGDHEEEERPTQAP